MKMLFLILWSPLALCTQGQTSGTSMNNTVPAELITGDSTFWTVSTVSSIGYVNNTPGANYNTYQSGGGMLVKFRFKNNNRFEFQLYVQSNAYGITSEAWTHVEGTVQFTKDSRGQNIFITKAEKGTYRNNRNGIVSSRTIPQSDLRGQHSCTYLWERTILAGDPSHIYLLMVDLEQHPDIDLKNPQSIDPGWVSKFHIPRTGN